MNIFEYEDFTAHVKLYFKDALKKFGMYYSETFTGNQTEMSGYGNWNSYSTYQFDVQISNIKWNNSNEIKVKCQKLT